MKTTISQKAESLNQQFDAASEAYLARVSETGGLSEAQDPERARLGKIMTQAARAATAATLATK